MCATASSVDPTKEGHCPRKIPRESACNNAKIAALRVDPTHSATCLSQPASIHYGPHSAASPRCESDCHQTFSVWTLRDHSHRCLLVGPTTWASLCCRLRACGTKADNTAVMRTFVRASWASHGRFSCGPRACRLLHARQARRSSNLR